MVANRMVKFIILAHARSGSTLVALALGEHQSVRMFGELFNDEEEERKRAFHSGKPIFRDGRRIYRSQEGHTEFYSDLEDGASFLCEEVFYQRYWEEPFAVGFKIFYNQARHNANAITAWDYLSKNKDIYVIHLKRSNLLECFISLELALMTKKWIQLKGTKATSNHPIFLTLDPTTCQSYFNEIETSQQEINRDFAGHPILELEYEKDLSIRFSFTMQEIQKFLGIPYQPLAQLTEKQAKYKPRELITNYEELKHYFRHTHYENFFE